MPTDGHRSSMDSVRPMPDEPSPADGRDVSAYGPPIRCGWIDAYTTRIRYTKGRTKVVYPCDQTQRTLRCRGVARNLDIILFTRCTSKRLFMTSEKNELEPKSSNTVARNLADMGSWLGIWAVACAVMFALRFRKVWTIVGGTWQGILVGYLVFFLGGALLYLLFSKLDRIKSEGLRLIAQLLLCVLVTLAVGGVIVIITL